MDIKSRNNRTVSRQPRVLEARELMTTTGGDNADQASDDAAQCGSTRPIYGLFPTKRPVYGLVPTKKHPVYGLVPAKPPVIFGFPSNK
jgi:hypothetical protein